MSDGVIADYTTTERMLAHLIAKVCGRRRAFKPRVLVCVPSGVTSVERGAVIQAARSAGAGEAYTIEEPMAAAIGAGLPISTPGGNLVVDIGGGTTDVAVISLSGLVYSHSIRIAGNAMDEVLIEHCKRKHNLLIGERTAENIKVEIGSAFPLANPMRMEVRGRDVVRGIPRAITLTDSEVREALAVCVTGIVGAVMLALERTPPELSADIADCGIVLSGGGALLKNLDVRIRKEVGLPVTIASDPLTSVVIGAGKMLADLALLRKLSMN
jgi:rod shape-determining protein MreB